MPIKASLPRRMLLRYIAIVLFPIFCICSVLLIYNLRQTAETEYQRKAYQLQLAQKELDQHIALIELIPDNIQQSNQIMDYIHYDYQHDWEAVYDYIKYIRFQLDYLTRITPEGSLLVIYGAENMLNLGGRFLPLSQIPYAPIGLTEGTWSCNEQGELSYYQPIWSADQSIASGIVMINVSDALFEAISYVQKPPANVMVSVYFRDGTLLYGQPLQDKLTTQETPYNDAGLKLVIQYPSYILGTYSSRQILVYGIVLLLLLLVPLMVYLRFSYVIAKRLSRLASHIHGIEDGEYITYDEDTEQDEIGEVIAAFNDLTIRTDILVNEVHLAELLRQQAEYNAYQAKIEPHFLYGTLDSIRMLAEEHDDKPTAKAVLQFAKLMRYSLTDGNSTVTIGDELTHTKRYLDLQQLRYGQRIHSDIHVSDPALLEITCPQYILQPLVENSLVHGIRDILSDGRIKIRITADTDAIYIIVSDNGIGIRQNQLQTLQQMLTSDTPYTPHQGDVSYALFNINTRLKMSFGGSSGVILENNPDGGVTCKLRMEFGEENP